MAAQDGAGEADEPDEPDEEPAEPTIDIATATKRMRRLLALLAMISLVLFVVVPVGLVLLTGLVDRWLHLPALNLLVVSAALWLIAAIVGLGVFLMIENSVVIAGFRGHLMVLKEIAEKLDTLVDLADRPPPSVVVVNRREPPEGQDGAPEVRRRRRRRPPI